MSTAHIEAKKGDIAKVVLMPGDPLRAKFIADTFLEDVRMVNGVRNMFGYTGTYQGKEVTVFGSGMGMPSIGIYSYELYTKYDVEKIIRIGSAGSYVEDLKIFDVILADSAYSESSFAKVAYGYEEKILYPSQTLNNEIIEAAKQVNIPVKFGRIHSSDVFYRAQQDYLEEITITHKAQCVEMESFALFANARHLNKQAACLLTISDSFITHEETTPQQRQESFTQMMKVALQAAIN